jgi:hypothetical protein
MRRSAALVVVACLLLATATVPLPVSAHTNDVRVDPQVSPDGTVVVETVFIANDGWLVLHADDNGSLGEPIGHTAVDSEGGLKEDYPVTVDEDHWADWEAGRVHAALHRDDGDGTFEPGEDTVLTSFGDPSTDAFTLRAGDGALVTARGFGPQETANRTLTVRQARLPADGYLVARNTTEVEPFEYEATEPVGATALSAGSHGNVTVALNRSFYRSTDREFRVAFAVYRDDGDGRFDADDEPVRVAGESVDTVIGVERTASVGTPTPTASGGGDGARNGGTATPTPEGGLVTTPTPDGSESVVVTASSTPGTSGTGTDSTNAGASDPGGGDNATAGGGATGGPGTTTGGQPGFGMAALLAASAALAVAALARRGRTADEPNTDHD